MASSQSFLNAIYVNFESFFHKESFRLRMQEEDLTV